MLEVYKPLSERELSQRKISEYERYCNVLKKGRENPIWFIEEFFGIKLIDYQKWVLMNSWWRRNSLWVCCRSWGKTALASIMLMAKMVLFPNYKVYISTTSAEQSIEVFKKIEEIALKKNPTFRSLTDIFAYEVEKHGLSPTGFLHNPTGHRFRLFNNSELTTMSGRSDSNRGKRGSVFFDECGYQTEKQMRAVEPFANMDRSAGLSVEKFTYDEPEAIPYQLLYASSASDVTFPFYERYINFSKEMIKGNPEYFVCDLNCDAILGCSTVDGEPIQPFLDIDSVTRQIETDPDGAERELYNKFKKGAGKDAVVKEEVLMRNSHYRIPLYYNDTGKHKFIFCYDPARNYDGSILSVWELINDEKVGYQLLLINTVSMVDMDNRRKTPLPMNEQLKIIRQLMIDYNGEKCEDWENIEFYIDAGAGGGGVSAVADQLLSDWQDSNEIWHRGIIDPEHKAYETSRRKYPNALPIVHLIEPSGYKRIIFNALERNCRENLISFTKYDNKSYILLPNNQKGKNDDEFIEYELSDKEIDTLIQNELMKNEISYMCRYETNDRNVQYELKKEKRNIMHDDRAYTAAMAAFALSQKRRDILLKKPQKHDTPNIFLLAKQPVIRRR